MLPVEIMPGVYWVGVNDYITQMFEGLWSIEQSGICYNSYVIRGGKSALIDLAKSFQTEELIAQIKTVVDVGTLDYIVLNHVEPDHAGALNIIRQLAPKAVLVGSKVTQKMLKAFYGIDFDIHVVSDGDELSLGNSRLRFITMPFVHWPESMMTYMPNEQLLFSNDAFGGYGVLSGAVYADLCDIERLKQENLRYFVNIVAHYEKPVSKLLTKMSDVPVQMIAPSHGPIWREDVTRLARWYREWLDCASGKAQEAVTLIYASMYQNTERMMEAVSQGVVSQKVPLNVFNVSNVHVSYILPSLLERGGVIVGSPTYEGELFPPVAEVIRYAAEKKIHRRKAAFFGSYGWGGGAKDGFLCLIKPMGWELIDSLEVTGAPTGRDLQRAEQLGAQFAREIKTSQK